MGTLYMTCGLAFAGKTTLARALAERLACSLVSLDAINRQRGFPDGGIGLADEVWAETHRIALARLDELLSRGDAVVDDTCCFRWLRDDYREAARRHGARAIVVVVDPPRALIAARRQRNLHSGERNQVVDAVFERLARSFEWPGEDEETVAYDGGEGLAAFVDRLLGADPAEA